MPQLTINFVDSNGDPIVTELFVDNVSEGTDDSFTLNLSAGSALFVSDLSGYVSWNQTLTIPSYFVDPKTITVTLFEDNEEVDICGFDYIHNNCDNRFQFFSTVAGNIYDYNWTFGDNKTDSGRSTFHQYKYPYEYNVTLTTVVTTEGDELTCDLDITSPKTIPSVKFIMLCNNIEEYTNNENSIKKCISSCTNCTCEDENLCRCVHPNTTITIRPYVNINATICETEEAILTLYVNDELAYQDTLTDDNVSGIDILLEEEGVYNLKMTLENCCGICTYEDTITAGPFVSIERQTCHVYRYYDYSSPKASETISVEIYDSNEKLIDTYLLEDWSANYFDVSLPSDGIYLIKVHYKDNAGTTLYLKSFVLYDFCDIFDCYTDLITRKLCVDCECEDKKSAKLLSEKIAHFLMVSSAVMMSISIKYGDSYGVFNYKADELKTLKNTDKLIKDLVSICSSCGVKSKSGLTTLNVECKSCK